MGRRAQNREKALYAVIQGKTEFETFGKIKAVTDWLKPEEIQNASSLIASLEQDREKLRLVREELEKNPPPPPVKDTRWNNDIDPCFIIANGESRRNFDLKQLSNKGYIIGMNVLPIVENFWPDALVSVDIATVKYICERNVPEKLEMWSYPRGGVKDPRVHKLEKDWGWSSGPTATRIALEKKGFKTLYILGMDFFGLSKEGKILEKSGSKINNMYKGTDRYRRENSDRTYFGNWLNQMKQNCQNHPAVKFYHVILPGMTSPSDLLQKSNWIDITYDQFQEHLQKIPKKDP